MGGALQRGTLLPAEFNVPPDNGCEGDMQIPQAMRFVVLGNLLRADSSTGGTGASPAASRKPKQVSMIYLARNSIIVLRRPCDVEKGPYSDPERPEQPPGQVRTMRLDWEPPWCFTEYVLCWKVMGPVSNATGHIFQPACEDAAPSTASWKSCYEPDPDSPAPPAPASPTPPGPPASG